MIACNKFEAQLNFCCSEMLLPSNLLLHSICQVTFETCVTDLMSTASSHQQLEKDVEEEQGERFKCEDSDVEIGQKGSAVCRDKTGVKYTESQAQSVKLGTTLENTDYAAQDKLIGSPTGQENASGYSKYFQSCPCINFEIKDSDVT